MHAVIRRTLVRTGQALLQGHSVRRRQVSRTTCVGDELRLQCPPLNVALSSSFFFSQIATAFCPRRLLLGALRLKPSY